jgi:hypothetical protein
VNLFLTVKKQSPLPPRSALNTEEGGMSIALVPPVIPCLANKGKNNYLPLSTLPLFFFLPISFTLQGKFFSSIFPQIIDMADSIFFVANKKFRNVWLSFTAPTLIPTNSTNVFLHLYLYL